MNNISGMNHHRPGNRGASQAQRGFTLIECMIALTMGMLVIAAATALLLTAQRTYLAIDDNARIDDTAIDALAVLASAIRQTAYTDHGGETEALTPPLNALSGRDNATAVKSNRIVNHSDVLATRFMATDAAGKPDSDMFNCAGNSLGKQITPVSPDAVYDWSIFYLKRGDTGEPELFCQYRATSGRFFSVALAGGIEAMQFLYGVDLDGDGLPDTFLQAGAIDAAGWTRVTAVSIALSVRGASSSRPPNSDSPFEKTIRHLFGAAYSARHAASDPGVALDVARFPHNERNLARKTVRSIVMLRNRLSGEL